MIGSAFAAIVVYALAVPLPGPGLIAVARQTMAAGRITGATTAAGVSFAVSAYVMATVLGIGAVVAALPWLMTVLQKCGGAYLLVLGLRLMRSSVRRVVRPIETPGSTNVRTEM